MVISDIDANTINYYTWIYDDSMNDGKYDTILFEEKDLKYSFGFSTGILGGPMQSDEKIVIYLK